jgi:uncharacterized membrane protein
MKARDTFGGFAVGLIIGAVVDWASGGHDVAMFCGVLAIACGVLAVAHMERQ